MPVRKRYTTEQIVATLREAQKLQAKGSTIPQVCKRLGIKPTNLVSEPPARNQLRTTRSRHTA